MARLAPAVLRLAGVPIRLHWTFLGVVVLLLPGWPPSTAGLGARAALLLAMTGSVLVHEAGHVAAARRAGLRIVGVTLYPFGGLTHWEGPLPRGRSEAAIAAAGPAASLLLAAVLAVLSLPMEPGRFRLGVRIVALGNLALGLGNLLPAWPLDGGRIARALLAPRLGPARATRVTAWAGQTLGLVLLVLGLRTNPWWLLAGAVLFLAASSELQATALGVALSDPPVERVMFSDPVVIADGAGSEAIQAAAREAAGRPVILAGPQGPMAWLPPGRAASPGGEGPRAEPLGPTLEASSRASEALAVLERSGRRAGAVADATGIPVGVVTVGMLRRAVRFGRRLSSRLGHPRPKAPGESANTGGDQERKGNAR